MILTEESRYTFYPDVQNNLSLPENERLAVEIIRPTGFQTKEMKSIYSTREFYKDDQPLDAAGNPREVLAFKKISTEIKINADYILRTCVGRIRNLTVESGGTGREITTGAELAECRAYGVAAIINEICSEVMSDEPTDAKKKS